MTSGLHEPKDRDGRIIIRCKVCGGEIPIYRFNPSGVSLAKNLEADKLIEWLAEHGTHYAKENGFLTMKPDFEWTER